MDQISPYRSGSHSVGVFKGLVDSATIEEAKTYLLGKDKALDSLRENQ